MLLSETIFGLRGQIRADGRMMHPALSCFLLSDPAMDGNLKLCFGLPHSDRPEFNCFCTVQQQPGHVNSGIKFY